MSMFSAVQMAPRDPILGLNEQFAADTNPNKVNLGVGVYTDDNGKVPLLECVRKAEELRVKSGTPKSYLPIDGIADDEFQAMLEASVSRADLCQRYMARFIELRK